MVVLSSGDDRLHCMQWTLGAVTALSFIDFAGRRRGVLVKLLHERNASILNRYLPTSHCQL